MADLRRSSRDARAALSGGRPRARRPSSKSSGLSRTHLMSNMKGSATSSAEGILDQTEAPGFARARFSIVRTAMMAPS